MYYKLFILYHVIAIVRIYAAQSIDSTADEFREVVCDLSFVDIRNDPTAKQEQSVPFNYRNCTVLEGSFVVVDPLLNYALAVFRNSDLRDVSLPNLRYIDGGVRIAENDRLCFVDTVDWKEISTKDADVLIEDNYGTQHDHICTHARALADRCTQVCNGDTTRCMAQPAAKQRLPYSDPQMQPKTSRLAPAG
ncbi:unnamed protein product [Sphagnum balticum]